MTALENSLNKQNNQKNQDNQDYLDNDNHILLYHLDSFFDEKSDEDNGILPNIVPT